MWLFGIARNAVLDWFRTRKRRGEVFLDDIPERAGNEPRIEAGLPYHGVPATGIQTADARSGAVRAAGGPINTARSAAEFFDSVPMARLAGERLENFPIETKAGGSPIEVVQGRKVALADGTGVVWETEDAVFTLESREISPDDLFQRTAL